MENFEVTGLRRERLGGGFHICVSPVCRFETDGILLARFAAPGRKERAADLCSGSGIVPLLWCRDDPARQADAFELQPAAAALARLSAEENGFAGLNVFTRDIRALPPELAGRYDLVSGNPPYRAAGSGRLSPKAERETARGERFCTLDDFVRAAAFLLGDKGRFCLCHRPARLPELFALFAKYRLEPKRLRLVQHRADTPPFLLLAEARRGANPGLEVEPVLLAEQGGQYTAEWQAFYCGFWRNDG